MEKCDVCGRPFGITYKKHQANDGRTMCYDCIKTHEAHQNGDSICVIIPGSISGPAIFRNHFVEFDGKKTFYEDITTVAFDRVNSGVDFNFIPVWRAQKYHFFIASDQQKIKLNFSAPLNIGNKEKEERWVALVSIFEQLIEPLLIRKLLRMIFENNKTITIGPLYLDKTGILYLVEKKGILKSQKVSSISWSEKIYPPRFWEGDVILYKDENGEQRTFAYFPMSTPNAVILPELINACISEYSLRHAK